MNSEQLKQLETELWAAADNLRANSDLKSSEYATPVLGLIFLKFADNKYRDAEAAVAVVFCGRGVVYTWLLSRLKVTENL